jgi:hypothetical protein
MNLVDQVFTIMVVVVALMQPKTSPEAFVTDRAVDLPLCENINDTISLQLSFKTKHILENFQ